MQFNFDDLVERKLVQKKTYDNGLSVYKYTKRVFFDALWNEDPRLLEARGMVLDADGNAVIWPFTKVFNHGENGTTCPEDKEVVVVDKLNGFMTAARKYRGELLVSTTGTLDSEYVAMARKHIEALDWQAMAGNITYMFEICDPEDPHIVEEAPGAYLIGARETHSGLMASEVSLDTEAEILQCKRASWERMSFAQACDLAKRTDREGYMIRDAATGEHLMKIKSPHYLTKKFLMRMGKAKVENMFSDPKTFKKTIDEEFYEIVDYITQGYSLEVWTGFTDQQRRYRIEDYFNE